MSVMNKNKSSIFSQISLLRGESTLGPLEPAYRRHTLKADISQAIFIGLLYLVAMVMYGFVDYQLLGPSPTLLVLYILRGAMICLSLVIMFILTRTTSYILVDWLILIWAAAIACMALYVHLTRPESFYSNVMVDVLLVTVFYTATPNRFPFRLIPALILSIGDIVIAWSINSGGIHLDDIRSITTSLIVSNITCILISVHLYTYRRNQFKAQYDENIVRKELETLTAQLVERNNELEQTGFQLRQVNEFFRQGLALAHDIQLGLLPQQSPWNPRDVAVAGLSIPASEVGGDFYTYIGYREEHLIGVAIGDISGKGMGAALMMALVLSAVETQVREAQYPQVLLSTLNRSLLTHLKNNHMNAGLMYITIDLHLQRMQVANAGMIAPLLIRAGTVQTIDVYGLPIGAMANPIYQEVQVHLQPNDVIVLVSDGIVEAHNAKGELFGFERLDQVLRRHVLPPDPSRLIDELMCATQNFTASCHQHDDMTVVSICPRLSPEHRKINDGTVH